MADDRLAALEQRLDRLEVTLHGRFPYPPVDPAPDDFGRWPGWQWWGGRRPIPIPIPEPGDPVPIDIGRLTRVQLQIALENIKAQRVRLDAVEKLVQQQLKQVG
jgi:hypothetical protein